VKRKQSAKKKVKKIIEKKIRRKRIKEKRKKVRKKKSKKERKGKEKGAKMCTLGRALDLDAPRLRLGSPGFSTGKQIEREKMR